MPKEPWIAHDEPNRRFDAWMWLDDCDLCLEALKREAEKRPRLVICLKTNADRVWVTAELLYETLARGEEVESLCYVEDDWVRETFVVSGSLPPSVSWRSLTLVEESEHEATASQRKAISPGWQHPRSNGPALASGLLTGGADRRREVELLDHPIRD